MRRAFVNALVEEARKNSKIMLIAGDLGFRFLEPFKEEFPDRFLNIGVAEANLVTVGAGLSRLGFVPFVYSIATFVSMRCFEQIRNDVCLQNLNVKVVGVGAGFAYHKAGPTHHSMEDIAIMRSLSNMTIVNPADSQDCFEATKQLIKHRGPAYLRIERNPEDYPTPNKNGKFILGKGKLIKNGGDVAILTTGTKIPLALKISQKLAERGLNCAMYSFPTIVPMDKKLLRKIFKKFSLIVTIEEHRINGGFGSAISEYMIDLGEGNKILRFGFKEEFSPISSGYEQLMRYFNLTPEFIAKKITNHLRRRR